jgi:hypothetical protein
MITEEKEKKNQKPENIANLRVIFNMEKTFRRSNGPNVCQRQLNNTKRLKQNNESKRRRSKTMNREKIEGNEKMNKGELIFMGRTAFTEV